MNKNTLISFFILAFFILYSSSFIFFNAFAAVTPENLKQAIDDKNQVLQEINQKLLETQKNLEATETKGKSLQTEIKQFDYKIKQLDLGIRSSQINIDKLGLEVESLQFGVDQVRSAIDVKKMGIAQILRQIQAKDAENTLFVLFKHSSLADSLAELQALAELNTGLSAEISGLEVLDKDLSNKLGLTAQKKGEIELENKNLKNRKTIATSQKTEKQQLLTQTKSQEKTYQSLVSDLEKQQQTISDEITKIEDQLRASFDPSLLPTKRPGVFAWPVKMKKDGGTAYISQVFGIVSYLYKGKPHNGLDFGGVGIGMPVFAAENGKVTAVGNNDRSSWQKYQYGKYILIEHNNNLSTLYAHLSSQIVKAGDVVNRGDLIGYTGNTGVATGPHLHLGVYWTPSILMKSISPAAGLVPVGVTIDPEDYL